jgi:enterochelin esterase-like enzyme
MMREILAAPRQPVRFWMEVGLFEGGGGLAGANQVAQNRHMRDVLLAKDYDVSYHEFSGGHDYACWRGSLADGLTALAGSEAPAARP